MTRKQKDSCIPALLRAGDIPEGQEADCYYSRGLPVYK